MALINILLRHITPLPNWGRGTAKAIAIAGVGLLLTGCREDYTVIVPDPEQVDTIKTVNDIKGLYLLNEGNMGTNKATLDYYDYSTGTYTRNIYSAANPTATMELGDVGNDLQIYGNKMYAVINCSNKIEVMDKTSAKRIGQIDIPNCRYIRFDGQYAYVTSYAGPVSVNPNYSQRGYVAKIDTASLQIVDTCLVGYQPDELAVADGKLYVANSGGYMSPNYERELSVIDIATFKVIRTIPVAINLHRVRPDSHHQLWVTNRGDYKTIQPKLYCVDTRKDIVTDSVDIAVGDCWLDGDSLYICGKQYNDLTKVQETSYGIVNVATHSVVTRHFITDDTENDIETPYGIFVNSQTKDIYVTDAKGYVTPGEFFCFSKDGKLKWKVATGDIPAHAAFVTTKNTNSTNNNTDNTKSAYINKVYEYCPAPGQFINQYPAYETGNDAASMLAKASQYIVGTANSPLSLGGFGGYVVFGFDHTILNVSGEKDFKVLGNAYASDRTTQKPGGSAEPGIIMVSRDVNGNGIPDDPWYEIAGSEYYKAETKHNYSVTYERSDGDIHWTDSEGNTGTIDRNEWHTQKSYYPLWLTDDKITFTGTRLADNYANEGTETSPYFVLYFYDYGYADNWPNDSDNAKIDIDWAVDSEGNKVHLDGIDFVKVYTGVNQKCGWLGETSTEVAGAVDLHLKSD